MSKLIPRTTNGSIEKPSYARRVKIPKAHNAERSHETARQAASANTRRAYVSDWRIFEAWCVEHGLSALPCAEQTLCGFNLARAEAGCSIRTVRRGMVSIRAKHTLAGLPDPYSTYARVHWRGLRNQWFKNPRRSAPLFGPDMVRIIDTLSTRRLHDLRSRALLLVGLCGALRRSELVGIKVEHLEFNSDGVLVTVPRSKTDQAGEGQEVPIGFNPDSTRHCPVMALKAWLMASRITEGWVFQSIRGKRRLTGKPMAAWQVSKLVQKMTAKLGILPPRGMRWSAHSLRAGLMTGGDASGVALHTLRVVSRHTSDVQASAYVRRDKMQASATRFLGLKPLDAEPSGPVNGAGLDETE